ncbi:MAG: TolC family protein [Verrucomicrobia bacterium]|nr:TolC family protein [Verrucomicrobiota bacterium]MBU4247474.1 TolC family protein [Verrucomicrobiota bacterium]MCG2678559.1 TolC family protein [Kiritimatiellia bacterium]
MNLMRSSYIRPLGVLLLALSAGVAPAGDINQLSSAGFDKEAYIAGARTSMVLRIGRVDCMAYALKNNSEVKIKRIQPRLREDDVRIARSVFEPSLSVEAALTDTTELSPNLIYGTNISLMRSGDLNAGVGGKLWTGTRYDLAVDTSRIKSSSPTQIINPAYGVEPQITLTQPLLRGAGITVNRAEIVITENNLQISTKNLQATVMDIITRTLVAYYDLYYARARYSIEADALERTRRLLTINQARHAKGLISSVNLLETETAVAERMKRVIAAEAAMKTAEDALKLVTNLVDDPALWNARVELLEEPVLGLQRIDLVQCLERAFDNRPDYQSMKIALINRDVQIQVARNGLLPTVDVIGSFGLNGLGDTYGAAADNANMDYKDWLVGVRVTVPWGRGDRARYDKSKWEKIQAILELKRLEQDIIFAVRNRVRDVDIQYRQTEAAMLAADMETKNYDAQQERYAVGQVNTHDILDYQNRLASARLDYVKAMIDYQIALIRLDQAEGVTLANNNITLENEHDP